MGYRNSIYFNFYKNYRNKSIKLGTQFTNGAQNVQEYKWKQNPECTDYTWQLHTDMTVQYNQLTGFSSTVRNDCFDLW